MTEPVVVRLDSADTDLTKAVAAQYECDVWDLRSFGYPGKWARFRGRADRAQRGATGIGQGWLLDMVKQWVLRAALRRVSPAYLDEVILAVALLSSTLQDREDHGVHPTALGRADITTHLIRLGHLREEGRLTLKGQQRMVRYLARVLEDAEAWGLSAPGAVAAGLPASFAVLRADLPAGRARSVDEPSRALPRAVIRQLLDPAALNRLEDLAGAWAVNWFTLALGTGRRPGELCALPLDGCLERSVHRDDSGDEHTHPVLVHDMTKIAVTGYRLPISAATAAVIEDQQNRVRQTYPMTDPARLPLFPTPHRNPDGLRSVPTWHVHTVLRRWVMDLPELWCPDLDEEGRIAGAGHAVGDGRQPFPRDKIYPYALRHTWAQDHADSGTSLEVLQDLLGHTKPTTTQVYYRLTPTRRRDAVLRLSRLQLTHRGSLTSAGLRALEPAEELRTQIGSTAVPFGICIEPANVQAGGHACPYRMRCLGCTHFRTDPSYLPELREHLSQLLTSRERIRAADAAEIEPWVRSSAMPTDEEIDRVRHLIRRCEGELDGLTPTERDEIVRCITQVRTARAQVARVVPLELAGIVRHNDPDVFPSAFERLRSPGTTASTGVAR